MQKADRNIQLGVYSHLHREGTFLPSWQSSQSSSRSWRFTVWHEFLRSCFIFSLARTHSCQHMNWLILEYIGFLTAETWFRIIFFFNASCLMYTELLLHHFVLVLRAALRLQNLPAWETTFSPTFTQCLSIAGTHRYRMGHTEVKFLKVS